MTTEPFIPCRDRPALDKGARIPWTELESGMLFRPMAGEPSLRRVRGVPQFVWWDDRRSPSFMVGSEDEVDGRPCGGVVGVGNEYYVRSYLPDGRPVYTSDSADWEADEEVVERLRQLFTAQLAKLTFEAVDDDDVRLRIVKQNLAKLDE